MHFITLPNLNPVPWTAPAVNYSMRQVYKAAELSAYQNAVKEQLGATETPWLEGALRIHFWFWRRLDLGTVVTTRRRRGHDSDATNMQKALEDALQGVLFPNDRDTRSITSEIVEQGPDVDPGIIIGIEPWQAPTLVIPDEILARFRQQPTLDSNTHDDDVEDVF